MTTQLQSRDSLIAAWQAVSRSQPLSDDLQDLLLMFLNKPKSEVVQMVQRAVSSRPSIPDDGDSSLPAPQRYQRRRNTSHKQSVVPQGPAVCIYDITPAKTRRQAEADFDSLISAPLGPVDTSDDPIDELALAFEAVHTRQ